MLDRSEALAPDDYLPDAISFSAALMAGKKMPPDAVNLLIQDHRQVQRWFLDYQASNEGTVREYLLRQICLHLKIHMQFEEELFYPSARQATGDDALVGAAVGDHNDTKRIITDIEAGGDPAAVEDLVFSLQVAIDAHIREEEDELFPEVRASGLDLIALGLRLAVRRSELFSEATGKPLPPSSATFETLVKGKQS